MAAAAYHLGGHSINSITQSSQLQLEGFNNSGSRNLIAAAAAALSNHHEGGERGGSGGTGESGGSHVNGELVASSVDLAELLVFWQNHFNFQCTQYTLNYPP